MKNSIMNSCVSVIIPVYKVEKFLDNCVRSVIGQTFKNIEILLIDDGSPDECPQMCDEWATKDSRIRVVHKENGGLSSARNTGIRESVGKYLYFLDSDDRFYDSYSIEKLWELVQTHDEVDMVQGNFYVEENHGTTFNSTAFPEFTNDKKWIRSKMATMVIPESACNRLVKRSIIVENNLYFREGWIQEDTLWSYQISRYINNMAFCYAPTYFYAYNSNSIMHSSGNEREAKAFVQILNDVYFGLRIQKKHTYDIKFLEIMATRAEQSAGVGVYALIVPYGNLLYKCIFKFNSVANNSNSQIVKLGFKIIVVILRLFLSL